MAYAFKIESGDPRNFVCDCATETPLADLEIEWEQDVFQKKQFQCPGCEVYFFARNKSGGQICIRKQ